MPATTTAAASIDIEAENKLLKLEKQRLAEKLREVQRELRTLRAAQNKLEKLAVTSKPKRAETEDATFYNVCFHMLQSRNFKSPVVISQRGKSYLRPEFQDDRRFIVGNSIESGDLDEMLNAAGVSLKRRKPEQFSALFPPDYKLKTIVDDLNNGDFDVSAEHLLSPLSFEHYDDDQHRPYITPFGLTAGWKDFEARARTNGGNASWLHDGRRVELSDLTPHNIVADLSSALKEVWASAPVGIQRADSLGSSYDPEDRADARLAAGELSAQGFGEHKTQMCMVVDKESFDRNNPGETDTLIRMLRSVTLYARRLDDNQELEVFSNKIGAATVLKSQNAAADMQSIEALIRRPEQPPLGEHLQALFAHFFSGKLEIPENRTKPVFCTIIMNSLPEEKFEILHTAMSLADSLQLPLFFKPINLNPNMTQAERDRMDDLNRAAGHAEIERRIDNAHGVCIRDPRELTPRTFLYEYRGFVKQSLLEKRLFGDQKFDLSAVDIHAEGRIVDDIGEGSSTGRGKAPAREGALIDL